MKKSQQLLFHGSNNWSLFRAFLHRGISTPYSTTWDFGPGFYMSPMFDEAKEQVRGGGWISIHDWSNGEGGLSKISLEGQQWKEFVKGWICSDSDSFGNTYPILYEEDFIEGKLSRNYEQIRACKQPIPSTTDQIAAVTPDGIAYSASKIVGIILVS